MEYTDPESYVYEMIKTSGHGVYIKTSGHGVYMSGDLCILDD